MVVKKKIKTKKEVKKAVSENTDLKFPVYNQSGETNKSVTLPSDIFGQKPNNVLLSQVTRVYLSNQKNSLAATKTRSEVAGGGRKPHPQKGTGRARAGSIRSPGRRGGGIIFGPQPTKTNLKLTKKMRQKALAVSLSDKTKDKSIVFVDKLDFKEPKTKKAESVLQKITPEIKKPIRLVLEGKEENSVKSFRNLKDIEISRPLDLNALDVLKSSGLIFTLEALEKLKQRFGMQNAKDN